MKRLLLFIMIFLLVGCVDTMQEDDPPINNQEVEEQILDLDEILHVKYELSYELSDDFSQLISENYVLEITEIDEYFAVNYYLSTTEEGIAFFDENWNELFRLEDDLNYNVKPYLYEGKFLLDIADHVNHDWRLFDMDGNMDPNISFTSVWQAYDVGGIRVIKTERNQGENKVLEIKKLEDNMVEVLYTYLNPGLRNDFTYLSDGSLLVMVEGDMGYDLIRVSSSGTETEIPFDSNPDYVFSLEDGYFVESDDVLTVYDLENVVQYVIDIDDYFNYWYEEFEDYTVFHYSESFVRVDNENNIEVFDHNPYEEILLHYGKIVHELVKDGEVVTSKITAYQGNFEIVFLDQVEHFDSSEVFYLELPEIDHFFIDNNLLYIGFENGNTVDYQVYNNEGVLVETITLKDKILQITEDGNYITDGCLSTQMEIEMCVSKYNDSGMQLFQINAQQYTGQVIEVDDDLLITTINPFACDHLSPGWAKCHSIVTDSMGNVLMDSIFLYEEFRYFFHDEEYIYFRVVEVEPDYAFGGFYQYEVYVYDYEMNLVDKYEEIAFSSDYSGTYYIKDDMLIYRED